MLNPQNAFNDMINCEIFSTCKVMMSKRQKERYEKIAFLKGKKEEHDKTCEVFNLVKNDIKDSWGVTGCSAGFGADRMFTLLDKILEELQS